MGSLRVVGVLVTLVALRSLAVADPPPEPSAIHGRRVAGDGGWEVHHDEHGRVLRRPRLPDGPPESKRWHADITVADDDSVTGSIAVHVAGNQLITNGRVRGRRAGQRIWGEVLDDDGIPAATFEGVIGATGVSGTFTARNDDVGAWSWDGPITFDAGTPAQ